MRIKQVRVSPALKHFEVNLLSYYNLKPYTDPKAPAFFLGIYTPQDLWAFQTHEGFKLLMFGSSRDFRARYAEQADGFISMAWQKQRLSNTTNHKELYIALKDYSPYQIVPYGDKVYVYKGLHGDKDEYYNEGISIHEHQAISISNVTDNYLINEIYPQTFCYFKPKIAGGNTTKWELMLMGRECIEGVKDPIEANRRIEQAKGNNPQAIRDIALERLTMDDKWLYTSYW